MGQIPAVGIDTNMTLFSSMCALSSTPNPTDVEYNMLDTRAAAKRLDAEFWEQGVISLSSQQLMFKTLTLISSTSTCRLTPLIETVHCRCSVWSQGVGSCYTRFRSKVVGWFMETYRTRERTRHLRHHWSFLSFLPPPLMSHSCKSPIRVVVMIVAHRRLISST